MPTLTTYERPLSPHETRDLEETLSHYRQLRRPYYRFAAVYAAICVLVSLLVSPHIEWERSGMKMLFTICFVGYLGIGAWVVIEQLAAIRKAGAGPRSALLRNTARITEVITDRFVLLAESDDEGDQYCFQLDNDQLVLLAPDNLGPDLFIPTGHFQLAEIEAANTSERQFYLYFFGTRIDPETVISGASKWKLLSLYGYPDPILITPGRIDDLVYLSGIPLER